MKETHHQQPVWIAKQAIHPLLWHSAAACFIGALFTDLTYWRTAETMWTNFSAWLLAAGLAIGGLSAIAFFIDWMTGRLVGVYAVTWPYVVGNVLALAASLFNAFVHSRDAWTSVVPTGLALSAITVIILVVSGVAARTMVYSRQRRIIA